MASGAPTTSSSTEPQKQRPKCVVAAFAPVRDRSDMANVLFEGEADARGRSDLARKDSAQRPPIGGTPFTFATCAASCAFGSVRLAQRMFRRERLYRHAGGEDAVRGRERRRIGGAEQLAAGQ